MSEWRDIESAPKDGTLIVAWIDRARWDVGIDCSSPRSADKFATVIYWMEWSAGHGEWVVEQGFGESPDVTPTHWQPLPPPPEVAPTQTSKG